MNSFHSFDVNLKLFLYLSNFILAYYCELLKASSLLKLNYFQNNQLFINFSNMNGIDEKRSSSGSDVANIEATQQKNRIKTQKYRVRDCFQLQAFNLDFLINPNHLTKSEKKLETRQSSSVAKVNGVKGTQAENAKPEINIKELYLEEEKCFRYLVLSGYVKCEKFISWQDDETLTMGLKCAFNHEKYDLTLIIPSQIMMFVDLAIKELQRRNKPELVMAVLEGIDPDKLMMFSQLTYFKQKKYKKREVKSKTKMFLPNISWGELIMKKLGLLGKQKKETNKTLFILHLEEDEQRMFEEKH